MFNILFIVGLYFKATQAEGKDGIAAVGRRTVWEKLY